MRNSKGWWAAYERWQKEALEEFLQDHPDFRKAKRHLEVTEAGEVHDRRSGIIWPKGTVTSWSQSPHYRLNPRRKRNPAAIESVGAKLATDIIGGIGFGIGAGITERYIMRKGRKNPRHRRARKNIFVWNPRRRRASRVRSPWAVCTAAGLKRGTKKFERCVQKVKARGSRTRRNIFVWNNPLTETEVSSLLRCAEKHFCCAVKFAQEGDVSRAAEQIGRAIGHANDAIFYADKEKSQLRAKLCLQKYCAFQKKLLQATSKMRAQRNPVEGWVVTRDGETLKTFRTESAAWGWLLRHQAQSVDWAVRHEGYDIALVRGGKVVWSYKRDALKPKRNPRETRARYARERVADPRKFAKGSLRTVVRGKHRIVVGCPVGKYDRKRKRCRVGTRAQSILHPMGEAFRLTREGRRVTVGRGRTERRLTRRKPTRRKVAANTRRNPRCNPRTCNNPRHRHNPLLQTVMLANARRQRRGTSAKHRRTKTTRTVTTTRRTTIGNPPRPPWKDGQRVPVEKARAWVNRHGSPELKRQFAQAEKLQAKANRKARYVRWKILPIGSKGKLDAISAMVHYGQSPETMYKPPKGSKKGKHMYRHDWGDGSGESKPLPVLTTADGRAMVLPLRKGQTIDDWMRG